MAALDRIALAREIIDYGITPQDIELDVAPSLSSINYSQHPTLLATQSNLEPLWPAGLAPLPQPTPWTNNSGSPLAKADFLVITWTISEQQALADVLTPGVSRTAWHPYDRNYVSHFDALTNARAPSRKSRRLASFMRTRVGSHDVLCIKSELHMNQDSLTTGVGTATLPVADLFRQIITEVNPRLVITTGTAGATHAEHNLGDVLITRAAQFRCRKEFRNESWANTKYQCDFPIPTAQFDVLQDLLKAHAANLREPDVAAPTTRYGSSAPLPGHTNTPRVWLDGADYPEFKPILTTDSFEFGTSRNHLDELGVGVEMGDAVLGLVASELGPSAPNWLVIRNASDPQINGELSADPDLQAMWAVWYYETYGYWTSVSSALATWAVIASYQ